MSIEIMLDGKPLRVSAGISLAAAVGASGSRRSVGGQLRAPFCGMGVCFECRVTVDGVPHQRACQIPVRQGMEVWCED